MIPPDGILLALEGEGQEDMGEALKTDRLIHELL
jgi:hypothetical protein